MIIIFTMILGIQGSFERLFSPPKKPILRISSLARDQKRKENNFSFHEKMPTDLLEWGLKSPPPFRYS